MIYFRFYEELNEYLPSEMRKAIVSFHQQGPLSVKAALASFGVPCDEVDLVLVNGESVPFDHTIRDGDWVSIYPIFETLDLSGVTRLRNHPLIKIRRSCSSKN